MSYSLNELRLDCNNRIKLNFDGGELSSDAGLLLLKEFAHKIGFHQLLQNSFKTNDKSNRYHTDDKNLLQKLYQLTAGYFQDDDSDELTTDPVLTTILEKEKLASQPTMSRFMNRCDDICLMQFESIHEELRRRIYSINKPQSILLDIDSTLFATFGKQEGNDYNQHYSNYGYHPLLMFDGLTGDLLKAELRSGNTYTSKGAPNFLYPLLLELQDEYPETNLFLRGDSGFADVLMYEKLETNKTSYAIRLKENGRLRKLASEIEHELYEKTIQNQIDYAVVYGSINYIADSWHQPRRVAVKIAKPYGQMAHHYTFIVTNMELKDEDIIRFYCNRGRMENFIKECKLGFNMDSMNSHSMTVNANRLQISMLAYNLFNWFRRLVLPAKLRKLQIDTIRLKLFKIAAKLIHSARYLKFKLCSSCPYQEQFIKTLINIKNLDPKLE